MEHWYALYTKPKKEHQVHAFLQGQGIVTYLPTVQRKVRRRDRPDTVIYFPCYLFARLDFDETPQSSVSWMPGIRRIVSLGDQPAPVPDEVIDLIRSRLADRQGAGYSEFRPGDRVRIIAGPLQDLDAIFDRPLSATERVRVLLDVLGRITPVDVSVSDIKKANPADRTQRQQKQRRRS